MLQPFRFDSASAKYPRIDVTIIVTFARYPLVMQVADRRLTWPDGSIADDNTTKSILWNRCWLLSYTGLATIDNKPTGLWLAELLAHNHHLFKTGYLDRNLSAISTLIGDAIAKQRIRPDLKRLAVVGVGWGMPWNANEPPPIGLCPYVWHISNFLDQDGEPTDTVRPQFDFHIVHNRPLRKNEMALLTHGQEFSALAWKRLIRLIRTAMRHHAGPEAVARLIVDAVQKMRNPRVGDTILLSSLPIPRQHKSWHMFMNRKPNMETPSFLYVRPNKEWRLQYGPIFVDEDSIVGHFEIRYGKAKDWPTH